MFYSEVFIFASSCYLNGVAFRSVCESVASGLHSFSQAASHTKSSSIPTNLSNLLHHNVRTNRVNPLQRRFVQRAFDYASENKCKQLLSEGGQFYCTRFPNTLLYNENNTTILQKGEGGVRFAYVVINLVCFT